MITSMTGIDTFSSNVAFGICRVVIALRFLALCGELEQWLAILMYELHLLFWAVGISIYVRLLFVLRFLLTCFFTMEN